MTLFLVVESLLALEFLGWSLVNSEGSDSLSLASTSVTSVSAMITSCHVIEVGVAIQIIAIMLELFL